MPAQDLSTKLFGNTTFSDILEEIHKNCKKKEKAIREIIDHVKGTITSPQEATLVVPLLAEFLEIGVKNDDLLIKMAGIAQRAIMTAAASGKDDYQLTEAEKEEIFGLVEKSKQPEPILAQKTIGSNHGI